MPFVDGQLSETNLNLAFSVIRREAVAEHVSKWPGTVEPR